ncbi:hypothetical protein AB0F17_22280 [Nonomuraea sp. NPDC026600]|uniref:hypothetical protein n=1 Tax=Nonomuraea sp. NPDC026600 TaxID=3155363 RepID=UPI00340C5822
MSSKGAMAKAAGVLGGAVIAATLYAIPAHAATFQCTVTLRGLPPISVTVSAPSVTAAEALLSALIPRAISVHCEAT